MVLSFRSVAAAGNANPPGQRAPTAPAKGAPARTAGEPARPLRPSGAKATGTLAARPAGTLSHKNAFPAPKGSVGIPAAGAAATSRSQKATANAGAWETQFEKKWAEMMGGETEDPELKEEEPEEWLDEVKDEGDEEAKEDWPEDWNDDWTEAPAEAEPAPPPAKKARQQPAVSAKGPLATTRASRGRLIAADAPNTPGGIANGAEIRAEHPDWTERCTVEAARPGQPQRLTIQMAEVDFTDDALVQWCSWMDRRLIAERQGGASSSSSTRARFKANTIDFSENQIGNAGIKALCNLLEKHNVRTEILRLTGNSIGNEGIRSISKYLMASSHAVVQEMYLARNKFTLEGVKWLLASLGMHPAYPIWNPESQRFVPLWLRVEGPKLKGPAAFKALAEMCSALGTSACLGEEMGDTKCGPKQCVNTGCCDEMKHNCVAHLCSWEVPEEAGDLPDLPPPMPHGRHFFAPAKKGARKQPPSGVSKPLRDEPRVLYEDDDIAVVLKPPGWSCAPNPKGVDASWAKLKPLARRSQVGELMLQAGVAPLQAWLLLQFGADPKCDASRDQSSDRGIAQRLDIDTSGPIVVGKTLQGLEHARRQIQLGVLKDYVALVHGSFSTDRGECAAPIDTKTYAETKMVRVDDSGQPSTTVWEVIAEYQSPDGQDSYTLVHCRMVTLRTHQIRVHMQHLGHPIVGDKLYGDSEQAQFCPRMFIHKTRIGLFNMQGKACIEAASLQTVPDLWQALGRLKKVGGLAAMGCGAPGL
eukprot:TRINITY_DN121202_c0_g1_i1.p1 TRINITY_DN121202_c0_g1~~TRINITY_DN121202_c0_g1_i1.p1  ORF type:complete len:758 (-),score=141.67 TRINITY_DN121202_c0_g1_i1:115-2388(-)